MKKPKLKLLVEERKNNMGQDVQRTKLVNIISYMIKTNIEIMELQMSLTSDAELNKNAKESIEQSKKALKIIPKIQHVSILVDLYTDFVKNDVKYFMTLPAYIVAGKTLAYFDTAKGYKELQEMKKAYQEEMSKKLKSN